jgi:hypothetical protein
MSDVNTLDVEIPFCKIALSPSYGRERERKREIIMCMSELSQ